MSSLNDVYPNKTNVYVGGWKSWKKPSAYVSGSWKDAKKAWVYKDGAWVLVWDAIAAGTFPKPPVATVSNEGVDSDVTVNWDAVPQATSYNVYNVDGTVITTNTAVTSFKDTNPQDGKAGYKVKANLPGDYGNTEATSNVLTLAQAPSSLTAAAPTGGDNVALTWSVSGAGHHDQIQVVRGGSSLAYLARGTTSYTDNNGREGTVESYKVRAVISGNHGPYSNTDTSAIPANVPTSVTAEATTTKGQVKLSWGNPAGSRTGYEVQANDGGWVNVTDTTSPSYHTFSGSSGSKSMRVRTLSAGGSSGWVTASVTPVWLYAPNVPSSVSIAATSKVGELKLTWSAPTSGDAAASYQVQTATTKPEAEASWTNRGNQASPYTYGFGSSGSGTRHMRVRASNDAGSSAYVAKSGTPLWDVTPPAKPVITSYKPEASWGRMVLRFTINDASTTAYRVYRADPDFGPPNWNTGWISAGKGDHHVVIGAPYDGKPHTYNDAYVQVKDEHGNETSFWDCRADYKLVASPIVHRVRQMGHTRNGMFDSVSAMADRPVQGHHSAGNHYNGLFYYGQDVIFNSMRTNGTHCGDTREATTWNIGLRRRTDNHGNWAASPVYLGVHGWGVKPPPYSETGVGSGDVVFYQEHVASLELGQLTYASFQASLLSTVIHNNLFQGFGIAVPYAFVGNSYVQLSSYPEDTTENGRLAIYHLG